jgi:CheY-like chemotaxis protein
MMNVLLVEDNVMNSDVLSRFLKMQGFGVTIARNGLEALQLAISDHPDIILMDISLPLMDGWEATRRLKSQEATRSIPVLALTAHAMAEDRERSLEAGCDDFETKPISFPALLEKIRLLTGQPE